MNVVRCSISRIMLLLMTISIFPFVSQATEHAELLSFSQTDFGTISSDPEILWTMEFVETGIKSSLEVSFEKTGENSNLTGELGWEYRVDVDGVMVSQDFHTDANQRVDQIIPLEKLTDGKHVAVLTVRDFEGKLHSQTRKFELNSVPRISATTLGVIDGVFDPQLTCSFFGESDGVVGMVEVYLDESQLKTVNILGEQNNKPFSLSELIGFQIFSADLTPGKHLLTITAHSLIGGTSAHFFSIAGSLMLPEIQVQHSIDNKLENLEIHFPASSKKIVGSAEVHYNRSTILAVRSEQPILSISRTDLLDAIKKHNLEMGDTPATMIISSRSANQVENWQMVSFQ